MHVREGLGSILTVQALVKVCLIQGPVVAEAGTRGPGDASFPDISQGSVVVEVSAPGFETARQESELNSFGETNVYVFLHREPPPGSKPGPLDAPLLTPKAAKELEAARSALLAGDLSAAQSHVERALKLAPGHPDAHYMAALLALRQNDASGARSQLEQATHLFPNHVPALILLSAMLLDEKDVSGAIQQAQHAAAVDGKSWRAQWLLAAGYYEQSDFAKARESAERALALGGNQAAPAQILLARSLAQLGQQDAAIQTLDRFLREHPNDAVASQATRLLEVLRPPVTQIPAATLAPARTESPAPVSPPLAPLAPEPPVAAWKPPAVNEVSPPVAPGVACSLEPVLAAAGRRAQELIANLQQFVASERIEHRELGSRGAWGAPQARAVSYMAFISETRPGTLNVEESRNDSSGLDGFPTRIANTGLVGLALVFHPYYVSDFEMGCEGLGDWHGQPAWQVRFEQRADKFPRIAGFRSAGSSYPLKMRGRAWISANTGRILRLEMDLMEPVARAHLGDLRQEVEYAPVRFAKRNLELWLPSRADVYLDYRGHRYHHQHTFTDFKLFSVETTLRATAPPSP